MNITSIGDLARTLQLQRDTGRIKDDLNRLTKELSSGVDSNLVQKFKGNFQPLAGVERGLQRAESYLVVISEHQLVVDAQQGALGTLRELGDISSALLRAQETGDPTLVTSAGYDALARFTSALGNLNTQVGGQSVFSGVATDQAALADVETVLTAIETEITTAGAATAEDVAQVVRDWFATGGGFDTVGYLGGTQAGSGPQLSDGEVARGPITADQDGIRTFLAGLAMSSLLGRDVLAGDNVERGQLAQISGFELVEANDEIINLQADIGASEGQLGRARAEVMAESEMLQMTRTRLVEADPYETAVELQSAETQLQTLYTITSRLSRLTLTGYL
ncbi:MAG: flagellin [Silicimonas sp.]|nr:flagellin [Silicimonas sp.]